MTNERPDDATTRTDAVGPSEPDDSSRNRVPAIAGAIFLVVVVVVVILATTGVFNSTSPQVAANPMAAAACNADAKTVETAVASYDAYPPSNCSVADCTISRETIGTAAGDIDPGQPSTYGVSVNATRLLGHEDLDVWPTSLDYAISLSSTTAGEAVVYVPASSSVGTVFDDETGSTGCNALDPTP